MKQVRPMTIGDIDAVFVVRTSTRENRLTMRQLEVEHDITPASIAKALSNSARGWVCEMESRIVGFAMGDADTGELTVLAILPEFEARGIGSSLVGEIQHWLFGLGHQQLWLVTTPDPALRAYGFYQALGWVPSGELIDEDEKFLLPRDRNADASRT